MNPTTIPATAQDPMAALKPQEIPVESDESRFTFQGQLVATPAAIEAHGYRGIIECLNCLQSQAVLHDGLDYLQVFRFSTPLWFIDDVDHVTALLPSDY